MRDLDDIAAAVIDAAIQVHRDLGPGLLESVYEALLARALEKRGRLMNKRVGLLINFGGSTLRRGSTASSTNFLPPRLRGSA